MQKILEIYKKAEKMTNIALILSGGAGLPAGTEIPKQYIEAGLLDSFQEEGSFYGKPVISLSSCVKQGVKLIIAVARPGSCKAIAKKSAVFV